MATENGRAAGFPSVQPEGGLSLYELADKWTQSRMEDDLGGFRSAALKQSGADGDPEGIRFDAERAALAVHAIPASIRESDAAEESALTEAARFLRRFPEGSGILDGAVDVRPEAILRGQSEGGALLYPGGVAVLSGAGGQGKSTLALQLALTAAVGQAAVDGGASKREARFATAGIEALPCRTLVLSYEDEAWQVADRAERALQLPSLQAAFQSAKSQGLKFGQSSLRSCVNGCVRFLPMRGWPLFGVQPGEHRQTRPAPLDAWERMWAAVRDHGADLVIIDPAMSAFVGASEVLEFVREFMDALFAEAEKAACGVLLIAHATKGFRRMADRDETGSVSGSAAWTDAARGVLVLRPPEKKGAEGYGLECVKANYARRFSKQLRSVRVTLDGDHFKSFLGFEEDGRSNGEDGDGKEEDDLAIYRSI